MRLNRNSELGRSGEFLARSYLRRNNFRILRKNFTTSFGEIDIIACKDGYVAFVEVKTRRANRIAEPFESVTLAKQRRINMVAEHFINKNRNKREIKRARGFRFDVISIIMRKDNIISDLNHIKDAF